jgi:hypothetical protein
VRFFKNRLEKQQFSTPLQRETNAENLGSNPEFLSSTSRLFQL